MIITLDLTNLQSWILYELVETYLAKGQPAYECMPEWKDTYTTEEILKLRELVMRAILEHV